MKTLTWAALGIALTATAGRGQESTPSIYDTKFLYEKSIRKIEGVLSVNVGGRAEDLQIIVVVDSPEAQTVVQQLTGGKLNGYKVLIVVSRERTPSRTVTEPPPEEERTGPGVTTDEPPPATAKTPPPATEQCDIVREKTGLGKRDDIKRGIVCKEVVGWTNDPEKVRWVIRQGLSHWESLEMPLMGSSVQIRCHRHGSHAAGKMICYTYIKHRSRCPFGVRQILSDIAKATPGK